MDTAAINLVVTAAMAGQPIADLVAARIGAAAAATILAHGGVWVDRSRVQDASQPAQVGACLTIHRPPAGRYPTVELTQADILYEDAWLLAVNKRAGWYTTATPWDAYGNVHTALLRWLHDRDGNTAYLHLAHQLDRDTSGILLGTKDPAMNGPLQAAFVSSAVQKTYRCLCAGEPATEMFEVRSGHGRSRGGRWRLYALAQVGMLLPDGQRVRFAHTSFVVEQRLGEAALLRAVLHTGRTHQIRLHLASLEHPLLGDARYGGPDSIGGVVLMGHLLHAACLRLVHPVTGEELVIEAEMPGQMQAVLRMLRSSNAGH